MRGKKYFGATRKSIKSNRCSAWNDDKHTVFLCVCMYKGTNKFNTCSLFLYVIFILWNVCMLFHMSFNIFSFCFAYIKLSNKQTLKMYFRRANDLDNFSNSNKLFRSKKIVDNYNFQVIQGKCMSNNRLASVEKEINHFISCKVIWMPSGNCVKWISSTFQHHLSYIYGKTQEGSLKLCIKLHLHGFLECIMRSFFIWLTFLTR